MKILVHSSYDQPEHVVRPEAEIYVELAARGHQVTIFTEPGAFFYARRFREHGIEVIGAYPRKKIDFAQIRRLRAQLRSGYDVAVGYNAKTLPNLAFASIGLPHRLIAYRGTVGGLYRHDPTAYLTALHPRVDGIVCVSAAVRKDVRRHAFLPDERVVTIHKGHDIAWYDGATADLGEWGIGEDAFVIICVANNRPGKGVNVLLAATKQLRRADHVHLLLVGSGFDGSPYNDWIAAHPLHGRIHRLGYRNDIPALMRAADVQVQPSVKGEGLPKTVIEAMGGATPSIVTTTGGSQELVAEGKSGFVVPVGDAAAITARLDELIADPARGKVMGKAAHARLATEFSLARSVREHEAFFRTLSNA